MGLFAGEPKKRTVNEIKMEIGAVEIAEWRAIQKAKQYKEKLKELEKELEAANGTDI